MTSTLIMTKAAVAAQQQLIIPRSSAAAMVSILSPRSMISTTTSVPSSMRSVTTSRRHLTTTTLRSSSFNNKSYSNLVFHQIPKPATTTPSTSTSTSTSRTSYIYHITPYNTRSIYSTRPVLDAAATSPSTTSGTTQPSGAVAVHFKKAKEALHAHDQVQMKKTAAAASAAAAGGTTNVASVDATAATAKVLEDEDDYLFFHPVYTKEELTSVTYTHRKVEGLRIFDWFTGYSNKIGVMTEQNWLNRIVFLESVAGVPGFVGGLLRHLRSLRSLKRDNGWIHTLIEEGENE
ncbi:hypothetical protein HDU76_009260, partial [Blyttiomyces sp. JEL0837]